MSSKTVDSYDSQVAIETISKIKETSYDETTYEDLNDQLKFLFYLIEDDKFTISINDFFDVMKVTIETFGRIYRSGVLKNNFQDKFCECFNIIPNTMKISRTDFQFAIRHIISERFEKEINCEKFTLFDEVLFKTPLKFTHDDAENLLKIEFKFTDKQKEKIKSFIIVEKDLEEEIEKMKVEQKVMDDEVAEKQKVTTFRTLCENRSLMSAYYILEHIDKVKLKLNYDVLSAVQNWILTAKFIEDLINRNLEPDMRTVELVFNDATISMQDIKGIDKYVDESFKISKVQNKNTLFDFIFKNPKPIKNILFMLSKCFDSKVVLSIDKIKHILNKTYVTSYNDVKGYKFGTIYNSDPLDDYLQIVTFIIEYTPELQIPPKLTEFFEYVCLFKDELMFDMLTDRCMLTKQCLYNACTSGSSYIVKTIAKMKPEFITKECLKYLDESNKVDNPKICDVLIDSGCDMSHDIIEYMLSKGVTINNIEKFGVKYDKKLYELCHKYDEFLYQYMTEFKKNKDLEMDLREMIKGYTDKNHEAMTYIVVNGITPDYMMYDDAVKQGKTILVNFLESNYGFKPNMETMIRIDNFKRRVNYYNRFIEQNK